MPRKTDTAWFSHLYDIRPGNGAGLFLQPRSPHVAMRATGCSILWQKWCQRPGTHHRSAVYCYRAGFRHPHTVSLFFSAIWYSPKFSISVIFCHIMQHLYSSPSSRCFSSRSTFDTFMKKASRVRTWLTHRCFHCQMEFNIFPSSFTFPKTCSLETFSIQLIQPLHKYSTSVSLQFSLSPF